MRHSPMIALTSPAKSIAIGVFAVSLLAPLSGCGNSQEFDVPPQPALKQPGRAAAPRKRRPIVEGETRVGDFVFKLPAEWKCIDMSKSEAKTEDEVDGKIVAKLRADPMRSTRDGEGYIAALRPRAATAEQLDDGSALMIPVICEPLLIPGNLEDFVKPAMGGMRKASKDGALPARAMVGPFTTLAFQAKDGKYVKQYITVVGGLSYVWLPTPQDSEAGFAKADELMAGAKLE